MRLLKRLFARKPKSQAHVVRRAVEVIDRVIHDVGIHTLVCGTFVIDKHFRLRFVGMPLVRLRGVVVVAAVQVSDIAEAVPLRAMGDGAIDMATVRGQCAALAHAVVRELGEKSPALRALPFGE